MFSHSDHRSVELGAVFDGACKDTRTAWEKTTIRKKIQIERLDQLRQTLLAGSATDIGDLLVNMANNPYSNLAYSHGINDANASKLARLMIRAFLEPFVQSRPASIGIDLGSVRDGLKNWIVDATLPLGQGVHSDIGKISQLLARPEQRCFLAASFASPLEFLILSLQQESAREH